MTRIWLPLGAALLSLSTALVAQQGDQAELIAKRDKKLQEEFLKNAPWITDYDKARAEAKRTKKPIFAYFTRSFAY